MVLRDSGRQEINLRYRHFHPRDTADCLRLLESRPEYDAQLLAELPLFWKRLFDEQAMLSAVVEQCDPGTPTQIVGFGADVFVNDSFIEEARTRREPGLTSCVIGRELSGKASPILRRDAIARANADNGLNVVVVNVATSRSLPARSSDYAIRYRVLEGFIWLHRGYLIKECLQEVWDETDSKWSRAVYGIVRTDYAEFYEGMSNSGPRYRPYLVGITSEEALKNPGSVTAPVFLYSRPRLGFSPGAQELLARAMDGETDIEVANALHLSLPAVKMRWRFIYERVASVAPELLPEPICQLSESARGREKRRRIVEYVRNHLEELRPFHASRVATSSLSSSYARR
jgi:hypothetical protein